MILSFDIAPEAIIEHDRWHSLEHLHERMLIPGFLRGSRWTAMSETSRYFVMYEVSDLDTLASPPYLELLNNPRPWTSSKMKHNRGMSRGFCRIVFSSGAGLGNFSLLIRFSPDPEREITLRNWLVNETSSSLQDKQGLVSLHLFETALTPEMTQEQRIRGKDGGLDWVLLLSGYDAKAVERLAEARLSFEELERAGDINVIRGIYQMVHSLSKQEVVTSDVPT